jgi:DNA repair protein RecO (recombination protein O)
MNKFNTQAIVLARVNYGEADRIITFLTPNSGKVKVIAKAVRKPKSKLAGGIELFSVSDIGVIVGRSEINTLASSRLLRHYGEIVKDLGRSGPAYEFIKVLNKATEDHPEPAYFDLLNLAFASLDDKNISPQLVQVWFSAQLLKLAGHSPNLRSEKSGQKLKSDQTYDFNLDSMALQPRPGGRLGADQIKFLRIIFSDNSPQVINKVQGLDKLLLQSGGLIQSMLQNHIRT